MSMKRRDILAAGAGLAGLALTQAKTANAQSSNADAPAGIKTMLTDVIVIGAGLSGLNTSLLLEEMGYSVTILEGRDRVGGRVFTMDDVPGAPEAGGSGIGSSYGRLLNAIDRYNIPTRDERERTEANVKHTMLNIRGENIPFDAWATHPLNPFHGEHKSKLPWQVQFGMYGTDNPLVDMPQFVEAEFAKDDISVYNFLKSKGFSHRGIELGGGTNMSYGGKGGPHGLSTMMMYNLMTFIMTDNSTRREGSPFAGLGGNQRIPEAMAKNLKTDIQFNTKVVGIRHEQDHAEVHLDDGRVLKAPQVVVTIPYSALRLIDIDAPITANQSQAINTLQYTNVTHLHFVPKRKFWEEDGMMPSMWTDGPPARFMSLRNNPNNPDEITSFIAFANDRVANHLDRLGPEASAKYILDYLAQVRPSTKGALEFVKFWSWQLDPFAGGAYASWGPGQSTSFGKGMAEAAGRIHFAGEHTSIVTRGMEAAMESGERVAFEVADLL